MISPVKFETNSRSPTKVRLSSPGLSWASSVLLAAARIDAQHLPAGHLRRHDDSRSESNLTASGTPRSPVDPLRLTAFGIDAPDLVGRHQREVQQAVGSDLHRVGRRQILQQNARRAAVQIELHQPPAVAALVDEQPVLVDRDAVRAREVVAQHPRAPPVSRTLTRPSITSVAYRLPRASKATSSGAMMSPPLALIVSTSPLARRRAR